MPPPKVVCTVHGVQQPLKVHRLDIADLATGNELLYFPMRGIVPVVEQDLAGTVCALDRIEDPAALFHIPPVSWVVVSTHVVKGFSVNTLIPFSSAGMMY